MSGEKTHECRWEFVRTEEWGDIFGCVTCEVEVTVARGVLDVIERRRREPGAAPQAAVTPSRPDYVHCVLLGRLGVGPPRTWCGRHAGLEWVFQNASHALLHARDGGRMMLCPTCSSAIAETLAKGTWSTERPG